MNMDIKPFQSIMNYYLPAFFLGKYVGMALNNFFGTIVD